MNEKKTLPLVAKELVKPRCHVPWQQMVIDSSGVVVPCCYWGAYGNDNPPMGNVNDNSIAEIWNGERYQTLRRHMAAGDLNAAGCNRCHALKQGLPMGLAADPDAEMESSLPAAEQTPYYQNLKTLKEEIAAGATILQATPTVISMTPSHRCNIRCTHCYQESTRTLDLKRERVNVELMTFCDTLVRLVAGGGEPFLLPIWRQFLKDFDHQRNPYLDFATSTNATVLAPEIEFGLRKFKALTINVSMDGTGITYERVRVGAKFDEVLANVRTLLGLVVQSPSTQSTLGVSMCVMKSNILDLPNFVRLAVREKFPIGFSPVVTMPPDETLACFNDIQSETRGWQEAIAEARRLIQDEFEPIVTTLHSHYSVDVLLRNFDLVAESIPWKHMSHPHYRVRVELPVAVIQGAARITGTAEGLFVYIFPCDNYAAANIRYYAKLQDRSALPKLMVVGQEDDCKTGERPVNTLTGPFHFDVSLPEGRFLIALSTKWQNTGADPNLDFTVVVENGRGRVINEFWTTNLLKRKSSGLLRRIFSFVSRRLGSWRHSA